MKKFTDVKSNISKIEKDELDNIIEQSLNIEIEGDLDSFLAKNITIGGKDILKEKIKQYIFDKEAQKVKEVLENVKYKGYSYTEQLFEKQTPGELKKHKQRISDLLKKDDYKKKAELQADRITNGEKAFYRSIAAEQMVADKPKFKKELKEIAKIFLFRSKQLGYNK
jgi:hypothetical protein